MILKCFSVLDMKAGMFMAPFFMAAEGQAIRACMDLCADNSTIMSRHPGDFALYLIGTWDDQTGLLQVQAPFNHLGGFEAFAPRVQPPVMPLFTQQSLNGNGENANG